MGQFCLNVFYESPLIIMIITKSSSTFWLDFIFITNSQFFILSHFVILFIFVFFSSFSLSFILIIISFFLNDSLVVTFICTFCSIKHSLNWICVSFLFFFLVLFFFLYLLFLSKQWVLDVSHSVYVNFHGHYNLM